MGLQLFTPFFERYMNEFRQDHLDDIVSKAHVNGITCNLCIANEPELAEYYLSKGVDTLLTDDYLKIAICCENFRKNRENQ